MRFAFATLIAVCTSSAALAVTLPDCTRTTHVSHGGVSDHIDLGEGRVMWRDWWSQEGTATDYKIVDCGPGQQLSFRAAEERMNARLPFDRRSDAMAVVQQIEDGARVFATFERMAGELERFTRDVAITTITAEPCACAALYPELRGDKDEFRLESL